jgi:pre-rRNA-processing protein TSR2
MDRQKNVTVVFLLSTEKNAPLQRSLLFSASSIMSAAAKTVVHPKTVAFFELGVSLYLWRFQALQLAVENGWGGHDSADKRDWVAGVLADMYTSQLPPLKDEPVEVVLKEIDPEDIEDVLTQVLADEFSVLLEDDSAYVFSMQIDACWKDCLRGHFDRIRDMQKAFEQARPSLVNKAQQDDSDTSGTDAEVDEDEEMTDAPSTSTTRPEPVIDEDGFELVQKNRRR